MKAISPSRYLIFFALAAGGCALDLWSKSWIFGRLGMPQEQPTQWLWEGVFGFTTSLNEGALFGIGQKQIVLFASLSVVAAIGILFWLFVAGAARDLLLTIALGLVTGGILGNLYDRLGLPGLHWNYPPQRVGQNVYAVRDWLDFQIIHWPIFNIADSLLVCGAALLVLHSLRAESPKSDPKLVDPKLADQRLADTVPLDRASLDAASAAK